MGERRGGSSARERLVAQQSFTTPITSFGAPQRGHPCLRRGKWKSINKDKTRLGEALICRITFLICVKYHWSLSLHSRGTLECTRTWRRETGVPSPLQAKATVCLGGGLTRPLALPAVRDDRFFVCGGHGRGRRETGTDRKRNVKG